MKKLLLLVALCLFLPSYVLAEEKGIITGVIVDGKTGDPLIEAGVEVVETGKKVFTDLDGKYSIELPTGKYEIRVFYPQYQGQRVKNVVVTPGKPARIDLSLAPGAVDVEVVEVTVEAEKATEATQLLIRKKAAAVTDSVSAETIAKQPDSDVASVVERAPGITVKDNKFVLIRGLSERYTSASLNETTLPSTQTERKVVPLNLFSSDVIESINVVKTYTPDLPGEFAAGTVQINTKDYPEAFEMKLSISTENNSETTGKDFKTYKGGGWDWLAFDDGIRQLPDIIPDGKVVVGPDGFTAAEQEKFGEAFPNIWNPQTKIAPPAYGANFHIGNKFGKFGVIFDLTYDADYQTREEQFIRYGGSGYELTLQDDTNFTYWEETYNWSGILNMGYELGAGHKISLKNFYTRKAKDQVRLSEGFLWDNNWDYEGEINTKTTRLYWSEESIYSGQLLGDHYIEALKSRIHWRFGYGYATLDEPDTRDARYELPATSPTFTLETGGESGRRTFTELEEDNYELGFDWEMDLKEWLGHPVKVKFGPAVSSRERSLVQRIFLFQVRCGPLYGTDCTQDLESIFNPEDIRPNVITLVEDTHPSDHYDAEHHIKAGYFMADTPYFFFENLRFVGGVRVERSEQTLEGFDHTDNAPPYTPINVDNKDADYFPSANLIYSLSKDMNLRLGYSQTVNRPEFREMSPSLYRDTATNIETIGNPDLTSSLITSYDLRWEWFISPEEILALSLFSKDLNDPIEKTVRVTSGQNTRSTFQNSLKAQNYGFEIEARKNLGFIHPLFSPFSIFANCTYVDSQVEIKPEGLTTANLASQRPLQGQSDYIVNVILEYNARKWDLTARLLYNYVGERIHDVSISTFPDIIEEPTQWLDFILIKRLGNWGLKLSAKNLFEEEVIFTQGGKVKERYKEGRSVSFSISYGI